MKYCKYCGSKKKEGVGFNFDEKTGEKEKRLICKNRNCIRYVDDCDEVGGCIFKNISWFTKQCIKCGGEYPRRSSPIGIG